jgi:ribonuclease-3
MVTLPLLKELHYSFTDKSLLQTALTHRSYGLPHNERLEFLGDGVLNFAVAAQLFDRFPELPEGDLSRLRAHLVRQESLYRLAQNLNLGGYLRLGEGELKSGGQCRPSMLADSLEAIFGAIYLDGGFECAHAVIARQYAPILDTLQPGEILKDAKTRLQEWLQGRKKPLPQYVLVETTGAAHDQRFQVACVIDNPVIRCVGTGTSRRLAEQAAAEYALKVLT